MLCSRNLIILKVRTTLTDFNINNLLPLNESDKGAFNLHLLEFTFIYQFYSRKTILVELIFWNPVGLFAFMSFHNHFKLFWYCVLLKMRGIFCPYLFWDTAKDIISLVIWVANIGRSELISLKCKWTRKWKIKNVPILNKPGVHCSMGIFLIINAIKTRFQL